MINETIVFGGCSGFGESILIKYQDDSYGIIDSFIDRKTGNPCVLDYLTKHSISFNQVRFVILTHYHQDHFTGIAEILKVCQKAEFFTSNTILCSEFQFLIAAFSDVQSHSNYFQEIKDIIEVIRTTKRKIIALSSSSQPIYENGTLICSSLSPSKEAFSYLQEHYKKLARKLVEKSGIKIPIGQKLNFQSVVVLFDTPNFRFLYGSDLEYSKSNPQIGWDAICDQETLQNKQIDFFKVSHHGSENGFNEDDWAKYMIKSVYLAITPYSRSKLPRQEMITKFLTFTPNGYITAELETEKIPKKYKKAFEGLNIRKVNTDKTGYIAFQARDTEKQIEISLNGSAKPLA